MAKLNLMLARDATNGNEREYIYGLRNNRMYFYRRPDPAARPESQRQVIDKFRLGAEYAKAVKADPVQRAFYEGLVATRGGRLHVRIMTDYLTAPRVTAIDLAGFHGLMGDKIPILALDDAKVASVAIRIRTAEGTVLEQGPATRDGEKWVYTATAAYPQGTPITITATAVDRPGNQGTKSVTWS